MLLWRSKWFIIGLFIVAVLGAGVYSTSLTNPTYEARASLLIMPPTYTTSLDVSTLPVNTYENIALTDTIKQEVIDELDLKRSDGSSYTVANLENKMSFEVKTKQVEERDNNEREYPFFVMKVRGVDPKECSEIANVWANKFMKASEDIRKGEVKEVTEVIIQQFEDTEQELTKAREELKNFKKESRLSLKTKSLNIMEDKLSKYEDKYLSLKTELGSEQSKYQDILFQLNKMEKNGEWTGELSKGKEETLDNSKNDYLVAQEKLLEFRKNNNLDILKQKLSIKKSRLKNYQKKQKELEEKLNNIKIENKEISTLLENEPDKLELKRSLTNDSFWDKIFEPEEIEVLKDVSLTNEIMNPIYKQLKNEYINNKISVESIPDQIEYYEKEIQKEENELINLKNKLEEKEQEEKRLQSDLNNYKKLYENEASTYRSLVRDKLNSEIKIDSLKAQLDFYENEADNMEKDIKNLQDEIWDAEIKKEELTQRVNDIENTYSMLSEKVEEARLTEAQRSSDVKFIAEAVPPTQPLGSNTKLNVAIAGVLAIMLGVFIVFFKEFLKEDEKKEIQA